MTGIDPDAERLLGKTLNGRYYVSELISQKGGMAYIFRVRDQTLERTSAAKIPKRKYRKDETYVRRFLGEAQKMATVGDKPNLIGIYDFGEEKDLSVIYFVMPYVQGGSLSDKLDEESYLDPMEAVRISVQVLNGLAAMHKAKPPIYHRDVKPNNILFDENGRVKLADFGVAKSPLDPDLTKSNEIMGTFGYIAPERFIPGSKLDAGCDVYSLGVVLYEMLTGRLPYGRDELEELTSTAESRPPVLSPESPRTFNPDLSEELERIVLRSLAYDPGERYRSAEDMAYDLRALLPEGFSAWEQRHFSARDRTALEEEHKGVQAVPTPPDNESVELAAKLQRVLGDQYVFKT